MMLNEMDISTLDTTRASSQPEEVLSPVPTASRKSQERDQRGSGEVWQMLCAMLSDSREQRLAYLLYNCGLKPKEIVQICPQEWSDIQEIYRLRRSIIERMLSHTDRLHLAGSLCQS